MLQHYVHIFITIFLINECFSNRDNDFEIDRTQWLKEQIGTMQRFDHMSFMMGNHDRRFEAKGEHPVRREYTKRFRIDRFPVTNSDFANFVKEKSYYRTQTDLNKFSYIFVRHVNNDLLIYDEKFMPSEPWLIPVIGARWDKPYGRYLNFSDIALLPVINVGFADAYAYCQHLNKRLPNEYEWELAARGNNFSFDYPWGFGMRRNRMNIFQGIFPIHDHGYDGYTTVSPVDAFPAQNNYDMYDMIGNVWEWTTTEYLGTDLPRNQVRREWLTLKGGSYIDTLNGDKGTLPVRVSIKIGRPWYFTANNIGFRCAEDVQPEKEKPKLIRFEDTYEYKQAIDKLAKKFIVLKEKIEVHKPNHTSDHEHTLYLKDEL